MLARVALPLRPRSDEQLRSVRCRTRTTPGAMKRHAHAWLGRTPRSTAEVISVGHGGDLSIPPWHMDTHFRQGHREYPTSPPIRDTCRKSRLKQALPALTRVQDGRTPTLLRPASRRHHIAQHDSHVGRRLDAASFAEAAPHRAVQSETPKWSPAPNGTRTMSQLYSGLPCFRRHALQRTEEAQQFGGTRDAPAAGACARGP